MQVELTPYQELRFRDPLMFKVVLGTVYAYGTEIKEAVIQRGCLVTLTGCTLVITSCTDYYICDTDYVFWQWIRHYRTRLTRVLIMGLPGVGKTLIARTVRNQMSPQTMMASLDPLDGHGSLTVNNHTVRYVGLQTSIQEILPHYLKCVEDVSVHCANNNCVVDTVLVKDVQVMNAIVRLFAPSLIINVGPDHFLAQQLRASGYDMAMFNTSSGVEKLTSPVISLSPKLEFQYRNVRLGSKIRLVEITPTITTSDDQYCTSNDELCYPLPYLPNKQRPRLDKRYGVKITHFGMINDRFFAITCGEGIYHTVIGYGKIVDIINVDARVVTMDCTISDLDDDIYTFIF